MKAAEWILSLLALTVSVVFFASSLSLPRLATDPGGLRLMPQVYSVAIAAASVLLLAGLARRDLLGRDAPRIRGLDPEARARLARVALVGFLTVLFPLAIVRLGYPIATMLYAAALLLCLKARPLQAGILAIALALLLYLVFGHLLSVYLPPGTWLEPA